MADSSAGTQPLRAAGGEVDVFDGVFAGKAVGREGVVEGEG